jgi:hypothetical protein
MQDQACREHPSLNLSDCIDIPDTNNPNGLPMTKISHVVSRILRRVVITNHKFIKFVPARYNITIPLQSHIDEVLTDQENELRQKIDQYIQLLESSEKIFADLDGRTGTRFQIHVKTMTINCIDVNQELCNTIFRHNNWLIQVIPSQYISHEMILLALDKNPLSLIDADIPEKYFGETINKIVEYDYTVIARLHYKQLLCIPLEVFVRIVSRNPCFIVNVPDNMRTLVLGSQNPEFYCGETLSRIYQFTLGSDIYNKYFGGVQLYYVTDFNGNTLKKFNVEYQGYDDSKCTCTYTVPENSVTWNVDKFITHSPIDWVPYYIYKAFFPDNIDITIDSNTVSISSAHKPIIANKRIYENFETNIARN